MSKSSKAEPTQLELQGRAHKRVLNRKDKIIKRLMALRGQSTTPLEPELTPKQRRYKMHMGSSSSIVDKGDKRSAFKRFIGWGDV